MKDYIKLCKTQNVKEFTQTLKELEKIYGYFPRFDEKQAEEIFVECADITINSKEDIVRYNGLRLAKFVVTNDEFIKKHHKYVWELYKYTIFDQNGHIRNAGIALLGRFYFALTCIIDSFLGPKKKTPKDELFELEKFFVKCFIELQEMEVAYIKENENNLSDEDIGDGVTIPFAYDTKNKMLKSIRRGIEEFRGGDFFQKMLEKHGYSRIKHSVWDEPATLHNNCIICDRIKKIKENCANIDLFEILEAMKRERERN